MTESDKELLEYAAKAAGIEIFSYQEVGNKTGWPITDIGLWNPLLDDGDALRLAVNLHIDIRFVSPSYDKYWNVRADPRSFYNMATEICKDENSATRRAIVRAAAEIGKVMI